VIALTACSLLYTRSIGVAYFAAGAVTCSLSVKVVKRLVRQPRPPPIVGRKLKTTYGCVTRIFNDEKRPTCTPLILFVQYAEHAFSKHQLLHDIHTIGICVPTYALNFPPRSRNTSGTSTHYNSVGCHNRHVEGVAGAPYVATSLCRCFVWHCSRVYLVCDLDGWSKQHREGVGSLG